MHRLAKNLMFAGLAGCVVLAASAASAQSSGELLPPTAKPGECYARVWVPATYRTETVDVLVREASDKIEVTAPQYTWGEEKVLIKEASKTMEVIPAKYDYVEEKILVKPASKRLVTVPAAYGYEEEKILDQAAHTVWKKGRNPVQQVKNGTGEIMCLVEVPATYKTVRKRVLKKAAHTKEVEIPAEYTTVRKRIMAAPPTTRETEIPAVYKTIKVRKLGTPAAETHVTIPEERRTVTRRVLDTDGHMEWRAILCETNMQAGLILEIQRSLKTAGYNPGPIDGVIGSQTMVALNNFQAKKGLARGGLTMETLNALGVNMKR